MQNGDGQTGGRFITNRRPFLRRRDSGKMWKARCDRASSYRVYFTRLFQCMVFRLTLWWCFRASFLIFLWVTVHITHFFDHTLWSNTVSIKAGGSDVC